MDWSGCEYVEVIPGKVSGVPLVRGSRVQADTVLESFELGESVDDIARDFDLSSRDIQAVLAFAGKPAGSSPNREFIRIRLQGLRQLG